MLEEKCLEDKCFELLKPHLDICEYGCTKEYLPFDCENLPNNGRCSHYYCLEYIEAEIDLLKGDTEEFRRIYENSKFEYNCAVAESKDELDAFLHYDSDDDY